MVGLITEFCAELSQTTKEGSEGEIEVDAEIPSVVASM